MAAPAATQDPLPATDKDDSLLRTNRLTDAVRNKLAQHFDSEFYLKAYPDVRATGMDPVEHYFYFGWKEARNPREDFKTEAYLKKYPELLAFGSCPLLHFAMGLDTGKRMPVSVPLASEGAHPIQAGPSITLKVPPVADLKLIRPFFDETFYCDEYPHVTRLGVDPLVHYMTIGWIEGNDPSAEFSTSFYLKKNPDIRKQGINPFLHYHKFGKKEKWRQGRAVSRVEAYALEAFDPGGALADALSEALELEPMLGFPNNVNRIVRSLPLTHGKVVDLAAKLRRTFAGRTFSNVVLVPHVRMSGATRIGGMLTHALANLHGDQEVLLVQTDASHFEFPEWFPDSVMHLDLSTEMEGMSEDEKFKILTDLLYGIEAKHVFNVQSRLFWNLMRAFGKQIGQEINITSYLFCWDVTVTGLRTGYPIQWLRDTVDFHHSVLTDSAFLARDIRTRFGFTGDQAQRVQPLLSYTDLLPEPAPASGQRRPRAMWAGRHDRQKRIDILVDIARANPEIDIWVYGKPVLDQKTLKDYNPPSNIYDQGAFDSFEETLENGFDFFLYTAEWDGIPTGLLEAAAARLPIVAPDIGGISELVDATTGWLVADYQDVDGYRTAIGELLGDRADAQARAETLYAKLGEQFSPDAYRNDLKKVLP